MSSGAVHNTKASVSEIRLVEVFNLLDRSARGSLDDKQSVAFALRASGLFFPDYEISDLESMSIGELRHFVAEKSSNRSFTRLPDFDTMRRPLHFLDRASVGKVRREELLEGLCTFGDAMTREDAEFVLKDLNMHKDDLVDVDKFLRALIMHPVWGSLIPC